jgi:hypothetical protein
MMMHLRCLGVKSVRRHLLPSPAPSPDPLPTSPLSGYGWRYVALTLSQRRRYQAVHSWPFRNGPRISDTAGLPKRSRAGCSYIQSTKIVRIHTTNKHRTSTPCTVPHREPVTALAWPVSWRCRSLDRSPVLPGLCRAPARDTTVALDSCGRLMSIWTQGHGRAARQAPPRGVAGAPMSGSPPMSGAARCQVVPYVHETHQPPPTPRYPP